MSAFKSPNLPALFVNISIYPDMRKFDKDLMSQLNEAFRNLDAILNRGIKFQDNVDCRLVTFTSDGVADTENTVAHTLGKVPVGFLVYSLDKGAVVYNGTTAFTKTNIYLKVNTATTVVKIIVF